jgi:CO dehydrogenase/acetyl-CoA synthase epsilon subunit
MKKILIIHRSEENEQKIKIVATALKNHGLECRDLEQYKDEHYTGSIQYWIRQSVEGYDLEGKKLYDALVHIGKYADHLSSQFIKLALHNNMPVWGAINGKIYKVEDLIENEFIELKYSPFVTTEEEK